MKIAVFDSYGSPNPILFEWAAGFIALGHECDSYDLAHHSISSCLNKEYDIVFLVGPLNPAELAKFCQNSPKTKIVYACDQWMPFLRDCRPFIAHLISIQSDSPPFKNKCLEEGFLFDYVPLCGSEFSFFPIDCEKTIDVGFVGSLAHGSRGEQKYLYPILDNPKYSTFLGGMTYKGRGAAFIPYKEVNAIRNTFKVSLNFHTDYQKNSGIRLDLNQSVYNIALSGVLQICDHPLTKEVFRGSIVVPSDEDWVDAVDYYVNHPDEGQILANKAREIALQEHTLVVRMTQLLKNV